MGYYIKCLLKICIYNVNFSLVERIERRKSKQIEHVQFVSTLSKRQHFFLSTLPKPATLLPKTATMSKQHSALSKLGYFTMNSFAIVAVFGNKVEHCFDKVERCFDIVAGVDGASGNLSLS